MSAQSVIHLALDGGHAEIRTEGLVQLDFSEPYSTVGHAQVGSLRLDFTSGPLTFGEAIATHLGFNLNEEYTVQGGRLRSGLQFDPEGFPMRAVVWEGSSSSIYTILFGDPAISAAAVLHALDRVDIDETDEGIKMMPQQSRDLTFVRPPKVYKFVPWALGNASFSIR